MSDHVIRHSVATFLSVVLLLTLIASMLVMVGAGFENSTPRSFGNFAEVRAVRSFGTLAASWTMCPRRSDSERTVPSSFGIFDRATRSVGRSGFVWYFSVTMTDRLRPRDTS